MARNIANEARWQKERYKKFGFTIDRAKGERFVETLDRIDKTPLEWFKEQVDGLLAADKDDTTVVNPPTTVVNDEFLTILKYERRLEELRREREDGSTTAVSDALAKALHVECFDTTVANPSGVALNGNATAVNDDTTVVETGAKAPRRPPPTQEMIEQWDELNADGLSFATIANGSYSHGYKKSAISDKVKKHRESKRGG